MRWANKLANNSVIVGITARASEHTEVQLGLESYGLGNTVSKDICHKTEVLGA